MELIQAKRNRKKVGASAASKVQITSGRVERTGAGAKMGVMKRVNWVPKRSKSWNWRKSTTWPVLCKLTLCTLCTLRETQRSVKTAQLVSLSPSYVVTLWGLVLTFGGGEEWSGCSVACNFLPFSRKAPNGKVILISIFTLVWLPCQLGRF